MSRRQNFLERLRRYGCLVEEALLIALLLSMIVLSVLQILLRNVFETGLFWADGLLRIEVLWLALLGAVVASREDRHITVDLFTRYVPPRLRLALRVLTDLFTAGVCALFAWSAWRFVRVEQEFGSTLLGRYPAWIFQAIIPVGFAVIAYRYTLFGWRHGLAFVRAGRTE